MILHYSFSEFVAVIEQVAKLADILREVVRVMHLYKVDLRYIGTMVYNF
jgi:hypothetical protein